MLCPIVTRLRLLRPRTFHRWTFLGTDAPTHGTGPSRKLSNIPYLRPTMFLPILVGTSGRCCRRDTRQALGWEHGRQSVSRPSSSPVALHFERRVAFLVVVLSVLILDRGRVAQPIGECKACADNERPCGQHDSHNNVSHLS